MDISGFAFLKQDGIDSLTGAWWSNLDADLISDAPPLQSGVPMHWERLEELEFPDWALSFLDEVGKFGLDNRLAQR
jgi:hypothetical protein